jgi:hypothetical protein
MGDFLDSLVARALGVETVVRPRPALRFEPQPVEEPEIARAAAARWLEPLSEAEPAADAGSTEQTPTGDLQPRVTDMEEAPEGVPHVPPPPATPAVEVPERRRPRASQAARPAGRPTTRAAPRHAPEAARGLGAGELVTAPVRPATRRRTAEPAAPTRVASELPPVRVTIGRIEVRAVAPPAETPPRPAPRRPAPLSLDEYLEQRRSGRR